MTPETMDQATPLLVACLLLGTMRGIAGPAPARPTPPSSPPKEAVFREETFRGKVVPYREALQRRAGIALVGDWANGLLALETATGLLPILPTEGARIFYHDPRNLGRPMQVVARTYTDTPGLVVVGVHSLKGDQLHEVYYWCEVCSIRMLYLKDCDCCQGPLELREHRVGERFRIKSQDPSP